MGPQALLMGKSRWRSIYSWCMHICLSIPHSLLCTKFWCQNVENVNSQPFAQNKCKIGSFVALLIKMETDKTLQN